MDRSRVFNVISSPDPKLTFLEGIVVFHNALGQLHRDEKTISDDELNDLDMTPYGAESDSIAEDLDEAIPTRSGRQLLPIRKNHLMSEMTTSVWAIMKHAEDRCTTAKTPHFRSTMGELIQYYGAYKAAFSNKNWMFTLEKPTAIDEFEECFFIAEKSEQMATDIMSGEKRQQENPSVPVAAKKAKSGGDPVIKWDYARNAKLIRLLKVKKDELGNKKFVKNQSFSAMSVAMRSEFPGESYTTDKIRSAYSRLVNQYQAYLAVTTASGLGETNDPSVVSEFCKQKGKYTQKYFDMTTGDMHNPNEVFPMYGLMIECVGKHCFTGERMTPSESFTNDTSTDTVVPADTPVVSETTTTPLAGAPPISTPVVTVASSSTPIRSSPDIKGKRTGMVAVAETLCGGLAAFGNTFAHTITSATNTMMATDLAAPPQSAAKAALGYFVDAKKYPKLSDVTGDPATRRQIEDYLVVEENANRFIAICIHTTPAEDEMRMLVFVNERIIDNAL